MNTYTTLNDLNKEETQVITELYSYIADENHEQAVIFVIEDRHSEDILQDFLIHLGNDSEFDSDFLKLLSEIIHIKAQQGYSICTDFDYLEIDNIDIYTLDYHVNNRRQKIELYNNEYWVIDEEEDKIIDIDEAVNATGYPYDLLTHINNTIEIEGEHYLNDTATFNYYDIVYCENCSEHYFDLCEYCDENENGDYFEYGSDHSPKIFDALRDNPTGSPKILIGFEIEKNDSPLDYFCKYELKDSGYIIEEDSSVSNGFELITPAFPLYDDEALSDLENYTDFIDVDDISGAGGHVNLSKAHTNTNLFYDEICYSFAPLLFAMYHGRLNNTYSRAYNKKEMKNRRGAIKLKHNGIVELRLISAVKDLKQLQFRIKLFQILLKLSEQKRSHLYIFLELNRDSELKRHLSTVYTKEKIKKVSELSLKMWQDYFSPQANNQA